MKATLSPEPRRLLDDLILLEHTDPGARPAGMSTNAYALLDDGKALLVDAAFDFLRPPTREIADEGYPPAGLLLSHRHLAGNGDMFEAFGEEFGVPIFLHPLDAAHPQAGGAGVKFRDPMESPLFAEFGAEVIHFPGQTEGSVMLYRRRDGLLLAGDSAMGPTNPQTASGVERLIRPPVFTSTDDAQLRRNWIEFDKPVAHLGPYHGSVYVGRSEAMEELMRPLVREEPTLGVEG
ncbi:MAG: MBL fold metallo-hydrolase [Actinomycetota bacterium]|nr:MBL fold metallo-hydrolase [Actinomycetota bacterium]